MNLILLIFIFLIFIFYLNSINYAEYFDTLKHQLNIYKIFKSSKEISDGLMFKKNMLPENYAALFIFNEPKTVSFWMKNTFISLDIIFLDSNYNVLKFYENTIPLNTKIKYHGERVKYALEVNSGTVEKKNIKINDKIILV